MNPNTEESCNSEKKRGLLDCYVTVSDSISFLRGTLMSFSFLGVLFSIYIDHGNDRQCIFYMKDVSFYYVTLSILFTVHYSLLLYNTAICMPFNTLTLAFFHYFATFITQMMIIVLLALGCFSCSIFESANPIPLIACTIIAPICFMCNIGTACLYAIDVKRTDYVKSRNEKRQAQHEANCIISRSVYCKIADPIKEVTKSELMAKVYP